MEEHGEQMHYRLCITVFVTEPGSECVSGEGCFTPPPPSLDGSETIYAKTTVHYGK